MKFNYRRVIPCLDVKDGQLVKGVHFIDLREVGDPAEAAANYSATGADELVFLDITATVEGRQASLATIRRTIERISIPLTVGGGIRSPEDVQPLIEAGVSRVSINTAAVLRPQLVEKLATEFGSEKIVIAIDTRQNKQLPSGYEVMINGGRTPTDLDAVEWARKAENLGAGEILPTSMDTDGTGQGYDIAMTRAVSNAVRIPVIASGGAGSLEDLYRAITEGGADAVLVASLFHFGKYTVQQVKEYLLSHGIPINLPTLLNPR